VSSALSASKVQYSIPTGAASSVDLMMLPVSSIVISSLVFFAGSVTDNMPTWSNLINYIAILCAGSSAAAAEGK
jgi:hypothetical protein